MLKHSFPAGAYGSGREGVLSLERKSHTTTVRSISKTSLNPWDASAKSVFPDQGVEKQKEFHRANRTYRTYYRPLQGPRFSPATDIPWLLRKVRSPERVDGSDGWSFLSRDNFKVMLGECPDEKPAGELGNHSYFVYLTVEGLDQLHQELTARGVQVISKPENEPWGLREFSIRTPDGHRIRFGEPIPAS